MKWKVISASVRGSAHQRTGLPNQDAVDSRIAPGSEAATGILTVSDGHGGARHFRSQVGSTLAVHITVETVRGYLARTPQLDGATALNALSQKIVEAWRSAVASDLINHPFTEGELAALLTSEGQASRDSVVQHPELAYGATLLVVAATADRILYMQLGDGDILSVAADGTTTRPLPADDRLSGNQTTSLCQPDAWREFRTAVVGERLPVLVLLSTDGYVNSFRSQEDFLQIGKDYLQILRDQGAEALAEELPRILTEATQQGSGDDITLGMLHADALPPPGALETARTPSTKSVMIRELTQERVEQQRKLNELESHVAGARKHMLQLRIFVAVAVIIAVAALTQQYWRPLLKGKTEPTPAPLTTPEKRPDKGAKEPASRPVGDPPAIPVEGTAADPSAAGDNQGKWFLVAADGKEIALTEGKKISSTELAPHEAKHEYARVRKQDNVLVLTNLSSDEWTVIATDTGKKSIYAHNDSVTLHPDLKITFHKGATATIASRGPKPS